MSYTIAKRVFDKCRERYNIKEEEFETLYKECLDDDDIIEKRIKLDMIETKLAQSKQKLNAVLEMEKKSIPQAPGTRDKVEKIGFITYVSQ